MRAYSTAVPYFWYNVLSLALGLASWVKRVGVRTVPNMIDTATRQADNASRSRHATQPNRDAGHDTSTRATAIAHATCCTKYHAYAKPPDHQSTPTSLHDPASGTPALPSRVPSAFTHAYFCLLFPQPPCPHERARQPLSELHVVQHRRGGRLRRGHPQEDEDGEGVRTRKEQA